MIREEISRQLDHDPHFRWRGEAVTRIENLSDIVFALALGMLVSSANPPRTFDQLEYFLVSIIPVTAGFALLLSIWHSHFTFFRRYGVADGKIIFLNAVLLFVVLYFAYPLRFAFDSFFSFVMMMFGDMTRVAEMQVTFKRSGIILAYFAAGYAIIQTVLGFMYSHALAKKDLLALSENEQQVTRLSRTQHFTFASLTVVVGLLACFTPLYGFAGILMCLDWPIGAYLRHRYHPSDTAVVAPE